MSKEPTGFEECPICGMEWAHDHERRREHLEKDHPERTNEKFDRDNTQSLKQRSGLMARLPWLGKDDKDQEI